MNCRPVTDRLIDSRILFALAAVLKRLESRIGRARLAAWNAAGRAAVAAESVGGLDVFAVKAPPRPGMHRTPGGGFDTAAARKAMSAESPTYQREREAAERPGPNERTDR